MKRNLFFTRRDLTACAKNVNQDAHIKFRSYDRKPMALNHRHSQDVVDHRQ